jgi:Tol biopolymer transport system component
MQQESRRYQILLQALERHWGKGVADLFERAWKSEVLADCPTFGEWKLALPESQPVAEAFKTNVAVEPTVPPAVVGGIEPPEVHPWAPVKSEGYEAAFRHAIEAYRRREWALARELLIPIVTESPNYNLEGYSARALLAEVERQARRRPVAGWVWGALGAFSTLCLVVGGAIAFLLSGALIPGLLGTQVPANSNTSSVLGNMPTYPVQPTYTFEWIPSSTPQNNHNPGVLVTPIDTIEPTQYNPVPLTGKIAFERRESNNTLEIFLMNPDGSGLLNLTQNSVDDVNPSWSPDGKSLVFHSYREDNLDLYRLEVDDRQVTRLTSDSAVDWYPSWSPEGRYIAFYSNRRERDYDIYLLNLSNLDEVIPVTSINGADAQPTWSPDGRQIVFQRHINGNWEIFVISIDGSGMANLTNHPADDKTPAFSPDGTKIAFMSERTGNPEIFVLDLLTGELVNLTNNPAQDRDPCWSPDGMYIIFETDRDGNWELYRIRADGSEVTRLTDYPNDDWGADWSD